MSEKKINIIGAGLAGSEAAWQLAQRGIEVVLYEMKPVKFSPAHKNQNFAELVCSNSFRSDDVEYSAIGLLHQEMRLANSLIMQVADETRVPAGGALAVDREAFAQKITEKLKAHPLIQVKSEEITSLPDESMGKTIIATGPLTSEALAQDILKNIDGNSLSFYDAIAPVVYKESIDFTKAWYQSRYDKGDKFDYINCPLSEAEYAVFITELLKSEKAEFHDWEKAVYFDGCLPIEVMAERGEKTLLFGPMKPVGLTNPHSDKKPYAVVQLRQDNKADTLRNIVGFQTKMKYGEQKRVLSLIPGLENAEFAKFGGIHKNTFIKSPVLLDKSLSLKTLPHLKFAGQITGCEGYIESAAIGLVCGYFAACELLEKDIAYPPRETAFGSMLAHLTDETNAENYQPMNINFGLFPEVNATKEVNGRLRKIKGIERKKLYTDRAMEQCHLWIEKMNG
ncbi:MAG: methylenetetrahydrofolate--tRNA-(uracil(54)-C(5))-methyltransferase (FADH(2)-oxidizing) TrmFO [Alphaproteobacteria bacterium]|nr:methylenetetrahydrofolate--tRNA-(uracil(54)-C(5))-methyltransferase (FADH(2)-oxidizing) TrmFO [Alphaproteobacteria bacterium]